MRLLERRAGPHSDCILGGVNRENVQWDVGREAQAFTLSDRKTVNAAVLSQHSSVTIPDGARCGHARFARFDEAGRITVGYEAELLAVRLPRGRQAPCTRQFTNLALVEVPHGEHSMTQLVLGQREQGTVKPLAW